MGGWDWLRRRLDVLLRKQVVEDELDDEIRFHIEMEAREHERAGVDPEEARRRAMVAFGGVERFKEEVRNVRGARLLDDLRQDLKLALRSLPRQPAFTLAVLLTLGIGIGGNVAMFAVLRASAFSALPYPGADRLVMGRSTLNDGERLGPTVSGPDFFDYREQGSSFQELGAIVPFPQRVTMRGGDGSERLDVVLASTDLFDVLGVSPAVGRTFRPDEGEPEAAPVALLSRGFWQRRFGGDPAVVGSTISIDASAAVVSGPAVTIVGVMPEQARFLVDADVWVPIRRDVGYAGSRRAHNLLLVGRLAPATDRAAAQAEVDGISGRLAEAYPDSNRGKGLRLTPLRETLVEEYRSTLALLVGAVVLLLAVACANVAGLLLARGNTRRGELAVRAVMGASGGRLTRQLMTESALLATGAGVLGVVFAVWIERGVLSFVSMDSLGPVQAGLSPGSVLFALALSLGTVALFGALPSIRAARRPLAGDLRAAGRVIGGRRSARARSGLVVAQVALTVVLLAVSGLLVRSLLELRGVDLGFDPERLVTAELELPVSEYAPEARIAFFEELRDRVARVPGVTGVALASQLPLRDPGNNWGVGVAGAGDGPESGRFLAHQRTVMPGYFAAMGIPLLLGRDVEGSDRGVEPAPIVLGRETASRLFGEESPLGRIVSTDGRDEPVLHEVVGVVDDVVLDGPAAGRPPAMYYPYHDETPARMRLAVRHRGDGDGVASGLRDVMRQMNPAVPLDGIRTMDGALARHTQDQRALAVLIGAFAAVAVLLAAVGLYGVLAYQVSRRIRELGIRMALGASGRSVTAGVVRGGLTLVGFGLGVGVPAALLVARLVRSTLFGVGNADPVTFAAVAMLLLGVGTVACLVPAARAARVDPTEAFRAE